MPAKFAMVITPASTPSALRGDDGKAAEIAARVASGPGFWTEWLAELGREGLLEALLAEDVIARALRKAPTGHKYDRGSPSLSDLHETSGTYEISVAK